MWMLKPPHSRRGGGKEDCNALWVYFMRHTTSGSGFNQLLQERKEGELEQE